MSNGVPLLPTIAGLIELAAFICGLFFFFVRDKAQYFKILTCAVGCRAIADLFTVIYDVCFREIASGVSVASLGYFGSYLFLFSANFGQFDSLVDDGSAVFRKYARVSLLFPAVFGGLTLAAFSAIARVDRLAAVMIAVVLLPAVAASYYNGKHLLLPDLGFGFIKSVRLCNLSALLLYTSDISHALFPAFSDTFALLSGLCLLCLILSAKRGFDKWWM